MQMVLAASLALMASTSVNAETATEAMRRDVVEKRAYEACARLYGQQIDQALIHPVCYDLFIKFGIPE